MYRNLLLSLLGLASALHAQDSLITIEPLPDEVRVGQVYNVIWNVEAEDPDVKALEEFPGFEKVAGPMEQSSNSFLNGVSVRTHSYAYSLRVAQPGTIALPMFRAKVKGKTLICVSTPVHSLPEGALSSTPDAMSKALLRSVDADGTLSAYVHKDAAYITRRRGSDEVVERFLTATEALELEKYLSELLNKN